MVYQRCLRYWRLALLTPAVYLLAGAVVQHMVFDGRATPGFLPLSPERYATLHLLLLGLGVLAIPALWLLRRSWWADPDRLGRRSPAELRQTLTFRYVMLLAACDTVAFAGCLLFLLQGGLNTMFYFAVLAMLAYAAVHPHRSAIDRILTTDENDEPPSQ